MSGLRRRSSQATATFRAAVAQALGDSSLGTSVESGHLLVHLLKSGAPLLVIVFPVPPPCPGHWWWDAL
jgi:hypothetical protein